MDKDSIPVRKTPSNRKAPEREFAEKLKQFLEKKLSEEYIVRIDKSLLYKLEVDVSGQLRPKDINKPKRGQFAFQTDILIERRDPSIPLVVIELKSGGFSTHDIITYSYKATHHKDIYPYLRYGFIVGGAKDLSKKFLTHNQGIDFAMALPSLKTKGNELIQLILEQINGAEKLVDVMRNNRVKFTRYEKNVGIYN